MSIWRRPRSSSSKRRGVVTLGTFAAFRPRPLPTNVPRALGSDTVTTDEPTGEVPETNSTDASLLDLQMPTAQAPAKSKPGRTRRVVVAEDEALIRLDVVETLQEAGYEVVGEAGDGE